MRSFRDRDGRKWDIAVDVVAAKRVRDLTGFDLFRVVENDGGPLYELRDDPELLVNVVYALCKPQVDAYRWREPYPGLVGRVLWWFGIGRDTTDRADEAFGKALGGDALEHAWDCIITELVAFFPTNRRRVLAAAAIQAGVGLLLEETAKLKALGWTPPASGANCSRWRGVSAWRLGRSRSPNSGDSTKRATNNSLGSSARN